MALKTRLRQEWKALMDTMKALDPQTVFVLTVAVVLLFIQLSLGSRRFFQNQFAVFFPVEWRGLLGWGWWFGIQGVLGFILPVFFLTLIFRKKPSEIGLGLGDWKLALTLALLYIPLVAVGTWILSDGSDFQAAYPHYQPAAQDWTVFLIYELLFLFYWMGWEYLWRGFVLFGTAHTFGVYAIFVQMVPFALMHADKPLAEAFLSILGGIALGALVWRCRSFWIAVPIHAVQMLLIDFWCTLRIRTGVSGIGPGAFLDLLTSW